MVRIISGGWALPAASAAQAAGLAITTENAPAAFGAERLRVASSRPQAARRPIVSRSTPPEYPPLPEGLAIAERLGVWPATQTSGVGSCATPNGSIPVEREIFEATAPVSCKMSGPAGEIYRLKDAVVTPACAASSPQAAIIITALRDYGIILADNLDSVGLLGTPDARWIDADLSCLTNLILGDFEPVNVSSLIIGNRSGETSH